jgi:hypothetical protein
MDENRRIVSQNDNYNKLLNEIKNNITELEKYLMNNKQLKISLGSLIQFTYVRDLQSNFVFIKKTCKESIKILKNV